jgi:site-specific recombinase XerD
MRDIHTPLLEVVDSYLVNRHDLAPATTQNYRFAIQGFASWVANSEGRTAEIADVEAGVVESYLSFRKTSVSAQSARVAWVALRSLAKFLAERGILHDGRQSVLRAVRMPKVKDDSRRALTDNEMWRLVEQAAQGEQGPRDSAVVWMLLGCGLRREELASLRVGDVVFAERRLHVRASSSKSVHARDVNIPIETLKVLDNYVHDYRRGGAEAADPLYTDQQGSALTGNGIRKLFERLKVRTGIRDLSAHMLRHTWATNFHRSGSGSRFDLMVEGGWTTGRMVERYTKARPFEERRKAPSVFSAARAARSEKRPSEMRPPQEKSGLYANRVA